MTFPDLEYFSKTEFREWADWMAPSFLELLDELRRETGHRIKISPAKGALGRTYGSKTSQHYWDKNRPRLLKVADVMPYKSYGRVKSSLSRQEMEDFVDAAMDLGFTGIGVYPRWKPYAGVHLDCRPQKMPGYIATWAGFPQKHGPQLYVALNEAWKYYDRGSPE